MSGTGLKPAEEVGLNTAGGGVCRSVKAEAIIMGGIWSEKKFLAFNRSERNTFVVALCSPH